MHKKITVLFLVIFLASLASATYISGEIKIDERGFTRFNVETDVPVEIENLRFREEQLLGKTQVLTNKQGLIWTFSLNLEEYDSILLDIKLPADLQTITSIQGNENIIDIQNNIITIIDEGKLDFQISYKLTESKNYAWLVWLVIIMIVLAIYFLYRKSQKKKEHLQHIMPLINENEEKIITLLMNGQMRQKEIRNQLNIPKASFTRYLINLEKKKLILREGDGKNKVVKLK